MIRGLVTLEQGGELLLSLMKLDQTPSTSLVLVRFQIYYKSRLFRGSNLERPPPFINFGVLQQEASTLRLADST